MDWKVSPLWSNMIYKQRFVKSKPLGNEQIIIIDVLVIVVIIAVFHKMLI